MYAQDYDETLPPGSIHRFGSTSGAKEYWIELIYPYVKNGGTKHLSSGQTEVGTGAVTTSIYICPDYAKEPPSTDEAGNSIADYPFGYDPTSQYPLLSFGVNGTATVWAWSIDDTTGQPDPIPLKQDMYPARWPPMRNRLTMLCSPRIRAAVRTSTAGTETAPRSPNAIPTDRRSCSWRDMSSGCVDRNRSTVRGNRFLTAVVSRTPVPRSATTSTAAHAAQTPTSPRAAARPNPLQLPLP